jgi:hypothetical protein
MRNKAAPAADGPPAIGPAPQLAPAEASRRWVALLQQIFEVDPLASPTCHGAMRIVAFITHASVIHQILTPSVDAQIRRRIWVSTEALGARIA